MAKSIEANRNNLIIIVNHPDFCDPIKPSEKKDLRNLILNPEFYFNLALIIKIIQPIDDKLTVSQSNKTPISDVTRWFNLTFPSYFNDTRNRFTAAQKLYILECIEARWDFILSKAHKMAFILDPRYIGDFTDFQLDFEGELFSYYSNSRGGRSAESRGSFNESYSNYRDFMHAQRSSNSLVYQRLMEGSLSPFSFWTDIGNKIQSYVK